MHTEQMGKKGTRVALVLRVPQVRCGFLRGGAGQWDFRVILLIRERGIHQEAESLGQPFYSDSSRGRCWNIHPFRIP